MKIEYTIGSYSLVIRKNNNYKYDITITKIRNVNDIIDESNKIFKNTKEAQKYGLKLLYDKILKDIKELETLSETVISQSECL